jgi:hypothetical protein
MDNQRDKCTYPLKDECLALASRAEKMAQQEPLANVRATHLQTAARWRLLANKPVRRSVRSLSPDPIR